MFQHDRIMSTSAWILAFLFFSTLYASGRNRLLNVTPAIPKKNCYLRSFWTCVSSLKQSPMIYAFCRKKDVFSPYPPLPIFISVSSVSLRFVVSSSPWNTTVSERIKIPSVTDSFCARLSNYFLCIKLWLYASNCGLYHPALGLCCYFLTSLCF